MTDISVEARASAMPGAKWLVICTTLCVAVFLYGAFGPGRNSGDLAYEIGASLPPAALLAGLMHLAFKSKESGRTSWIGFLLIYATFIAAAAVSTDRHRAEARNLAAELQQAISDIQTANAKGSELPAALPASAPVHGQASAGIAVVRSMMNRALAQRREYEAELESIGWSKVLDGERLGRDKGLKESQAMIQRAKEVVQKYQLKAPELFAQARRDIESADIDFNARRSMLAGFEKSISQGRERMATMWTLEEEGISQFENIFKLLSSKRGAWQIEDGRLAFNRQADLDAFNDAISHVQNIVKKQEELQNAALEKAKSSLSQMAQ